MAISMLREHIQAFIREPGSSIFHKFYFLGLCLFALAMPTSHVLMSVALMGISANWLIEGRFRKKFSKLAGSPAMLALLFIYFLHLAGLFWTEDLEYAILKDLKDKLPLLALPIIAGSSKPLKKQQSLIVAIFFAAGLLFASVYGVISGLFNPELPFRKLSPFISHVYMSMMVVMGAVLLPWLSLEKHAGKKWLYAACLLAGWLVIYLLVLRSLTGLLILAGVVALVLIKILRTSHSFALRTASLTALLLLPLAGAGVGWFMWGTLTRVHDPYLPPAYETTHSGNAYDHDLKESLRENGHYVFRYLAADELRQEWNKVSDIGFDSLDYSGQELRYTLYRYMSSLGLRKDSTGFSKLSPADIQNIETGMPNYLYAQWPGFLVRIHQSFWEIHRYMETGNPSGHTLSQRIELWRASLKAFAMKPLFGWGTGDIYTAVESGLNSLDSVMELRRMKPHNQYLLFMLTLGAAGFLLIVAAYVYFIRKSGIQGLFPFQAFMVIMLISMAGNNPIDAQAGQAFFSFFSIYFACLYKPG